MASPVGNGPKERITSQEETRSNCSRFSVVESVSWAYSYLKTLIEKTTRVTNTLFSSIISSFKKPMPEEEGIELLDVSTWKSRSPSNCSPPPIPSEPAPPIPSEPAPPNYPAPPVPLPKYIPVDKLGLPEWLKEDDSDCDPEWLHRPLAQAPKPREEPKSLIQRFFGFS